MQYRFADCLLDTSRHALSRGGAEVHVEPQVFALLVLLVESGGDLVSRDAMVETVWQGRIVSEATIAARISAARAAVGDDGQRQAVIRTVTRRGLQLAVPVESGPAPAVAEAPGPARAGGNGDRQEVRLTTSADGTGIAWAKSGSGPPLLRAGHWMSHLELDWHSPVWQPLLERLGRGHTLYRYDPRGTGLSDRDCADFGQEAQVADLCAVADAAGLERFALYAVSQSVPYAVTFAARHPERVSALVLHAGLVQGSTVRERQSGQGENMTETFLSLIRSGWGRPESAFMQAFSTLFLPNGTRAQIDSFIEMQTRSATPEVAGAIRRAIGEVDVTDQLAQVRCPVLVCHARGDAVQPFEQGQLMARKLPDARFLALETGTHIIPPQDPAWDVMVSAAEAFLAEYGG